MGSKNSTENAGGYVLDGPQDFEFDEQKTIFEKGNGMLFRLINNSAHQWAFYNDTKKYEFHVTVTFGSQSRNLQALGKTSLVELPEGGWCAKVIVYPGLTEPFIQGEPVGFDVNANCVLLTTEYQEKKKEEKREAKKEAKEAKKAAKAAQEGN